MERAQSYLEAGADAIFPEALAKRAGVSRFRPGGQSAAAGEHDGVWQESAAFVSSSWPSFGYRMVIFPQTAFRVSMNAAGEMLRDLKKRGTQEGWLDRMQTRKELYDLLDYDPTAKVGTIR